MSVEIKKEIQLQIAHILFIDIVGYSKLSVNDQHAAVEELNQIVRAAGAISTSRFACQATPYMRIRQCPTRQYPQVSV